MTVNLSQRKVLGEWKYVDSSVFLFERENALEAVLKPYSSNNERILNIDCGILEEHLCGDQFLETIKKLKGAAELVFTALPYPSEKQAEKVWVFEGKKVAAVQAAGAKKSLEKASRESDKEYKNALVRLELAQKLQGETKNRLSDLGEAIFRVRYSLFAMKANRMSGCVGVQEEGFVDFLQEIDAAGVSAGRIKIESLLKRSDSKLHQKLLSAVAHEFFGSQDLAIQLYLELAREADVPAPYLIPCLTRGYELAQRGSVSNPLSVPDFLEGIRGNLSSIEDKDIQPLLDYKKKIQTSFRRSLQILEDHIPLGSVSCQIVFDEEDKGVHWWINSSLIPDLKSAGVQLAISQDSKKRFPKQKRDLSPLPSEFEEIGCLSKEAVAQKLWLGEKLFISDSSWEKVKTADAYLREQGFELAGVEAGGNCFFHAFLGSYNTLSFAQKKPIPDVQTNKISWLRQSVVAEHQKLSTVSKKRILELSQDRVLVSSTEGCLLASVLDLPIRLVTINETGEGSKIDDILFSKDRSSENWSKVVKKPENCVLIVDLRGHFVYARPILKEKEKTLTDKDTSTQFSKRSTKPQDLNSWMIVVCTPALKNVGRHDNMIDSFLKLHERDDSHEVCLLYFEGDRDSSCPVPLLQSVSGSGLSHLDMCVEGSSSLYYSTLLEMFESVDVFGREICKQVRGKFLDCVDEVMKGKPSVQPPTADSIQELVKTLSYPLDFPISLGFREAVVRTLVEKARGEREVAWEAVRALRECITYPSRFFVPVAAQRVAVQALGELAKRGGMFAEEATNGLIGSVMIPVMWVGVQEVATRNLKGLRDQGEKGFEKEQHRLRAYVVDGVPPPISVGVQRVAMQFLRELAGGSGERAWQVFDVLRGLLKGDMPYRAGPEVQTAAAVALGELAVGSGERAQQAFNVVRDLLKVDMPYRAGPEVQAAAMATLGELAGGSGDIAQKAFDVVRDLLKVDMAYRAGPEVQAAAMATLGELAVGSGERAQQAFDVLIGLLKGDMAYRAGPEVQAAAMATLGELAGGSGDIAQQAFDVLRYLLEGYTSYRAGPEAQAAAVRTLRGLAVGSGERAQQAFDLLRYLLARGMIYCPGSEAHTAVVTALGELAGESGERAQQAFDVLIGLLKGDMAYRAGPEAQTAAAAALGELARGIGERAQQAFDVLIDLLERDMPYRVGPKARTSAVAALGELAVGSGERAQQAFDVLRHLLEGDMAYRAGPEVQAAAMATLGELAVGSGERAQQAFDVLRHLLERGGMLYRAGPEVQTAAVTALGELAGGSGERAQEAFNVLRHLLESGGMLYRAGPEVQTAAVTALGELAGGSGERAQQAFDVLRHLLERGGMLYRAGPEAQAAVVTVLGELAEGSGERAQQAFNVLRGLLEGGILYRARPEVQTALVTALGKIKEKAEHFRQTRLQWAQSPGGEKVPTQEFKQDLKQESKRDSDWSMKKHEEQKSAAFVEERKKLGGQEETHLPGMGTPFLNPP